MNIPCEECNSSKHKCSIVASPVRFLQNLEELRPMMNLGPEGASVYNSSRFALLKPNCPSPLACFAKCNRAPPGVRPGLCSTGTFDASFRAFSGRGLSAIFEYGRCPSRGLCSFRIREPRRCRPPSVFIEPTPLDAPASP
jgi:hypothetical protein